MVVGELYKNFKTQIGGSCYLLSQKKLTNKVPLVTDHVAASLACHAPGEGARGGLPSVGDVDISGPRPRLEGVHLTDEAVQMSTATTNATAEKRNKWWKDYRTRNRKHRLFQETRVF